MSATSRFLLPGSLLALAGALWLSHVRQLERLDVLEREVVTLREEVRQLNARPASPPPQAAAGVSVPPEVIAARVAQLLDARLQARPPESTQAAAPSPPVAPTPERQAALARAQHLVESVLSAREVRLDNATELRASLTALGPTAEAHALRLKLMAASNRGELKLPRGVIPFLP